jgi:hypothetical protein
LIPEQPPHKHGSFGKPAAIRDVAASRPLAPSEDFGNAIMRRTWNGLSPETR